MQFKKVFEAFSDLGKMSDQELKKGKKLTPGEDNFKETTGDIFHKAITKIRVNDIGRKDLSKGLENLTVYSKSEYNKMKCYLGKNNSSGYALSDHGKELVSVFSSQASSADAIVQDAIKNGARHLDCFAERNNGKITGALYKLYSRNNFKINKGLNSGKEGEPYSIQNGISSFVDSDEVVQEDNPVVVVFMKL